MIEIGWSDPDDDDFGKPERVTHEALIEMTQAPNTMQIPQDCVYAECLMSGDRVGPVWGHGDASVRRALATLTEECSCGATFHVDEGA